MVSDLTINISKLSEGAHEYEFEVEPTNLELDARFTGRISVSATLEKTGHQMLLKVDLQSGCRFTCDRCLDDFDQNLTTHYQIVCVTEEEAAGGKAGEELQYLSPDTTMLDLGDDVRQFLILAVPQKLLCRDDCQGLCPTCGANRNKVSCSCSEKKSDPRWEGLRKVSFN